VIPVDTVRLRLTCDCGFHLMRDTPTCLRSSIWPGGCEASSAAVAMGGGVVDLASGNMLARDRRETGAWFDAARRAALGMGPLDGT
jgi:hypothetical protein